MRTLENLLLSAGALGAAALLAVLIFPGRAEAVPTGTTCSASGCFTDGVGDQRTNTGAATESLEVEFCLTNVANRALAASDYLAGAKSFYVQNRSSATCYLSLDAETLTTTGSKGYKFAAGDERSFDIDGSVFGPLIRWACTAAQTTGACLFFGWLK
jgi:hypothetical protein